MITELVLLARNCSRQAEGSFGNDMDCRNEQDDECIAVTNLLVLIQDLQEL